GWPVLLVVDVRGQASSVAALLRGFLLHRADVAIAGVIFNRVGGPAHEEMLRAAAAPLGLPVLGCLPRDPGLALPQRHLGLVQAREHADLEGFLDGAAKLVASRVDLAMLAGPGRARRRAERPAVGRPGIFPPRPRIPAA